MRAYLPAYSIETLPTLAAVLEKMANEPGNWKPFAGGTDLMVLLEAGKLPHKKFLNIRNLPELRGIETNAKYLTLGALTTYTEIRRNESVCREFPLLARAAAETGGIATQNRGTLGGNIANASPAADSPPALLVYDAELEIVSAHGSRWLPYHGFWSGYKKIQMQDNELIRAIRLPRSFSRWKQHYRKVGTRRAQAISKVCFAGAARMEGHTVVDIRLALGSVAPVVLRPVATEAVLRGERISRELIRRAQEAMSREIAPIDDIRSTAQYRLRVAQNLLSEFLETVTQ